MPEDAERSDSEPATGRDAAAPGPAADRPDADPASASPPSAAPAVGPTGDTPHDTPHETPRDPVATGVEDTVGPAVEPEDAPVVEPAVDAPGSDREAPVDADDRFDALARAVDQLAERMLVLEAAVAAVGSTGPVLDAVAALDRRVGELARLGSHHEELIDKLHAENQALRKGELTQALAPLLRDLIRLSDQLVQLDETSPEPGKGDASLANRQVLEILARSGVRVDEAQAGDAFDPAVHHGVGRVPTDDPGADGTIGVVRRPGFVGPDGRVLRPAEVEVHRFEPPEPAPPTASEPAAPDGTIEGDE